MSEPYTQDNATMYRHLAFAALIFTTLTGCAKMPTYEWIPQHSADVGFPMEVVSGSLNFEDGSSTPIPAKKVFNPGWGTSQRSMLIGDAQKPVPVSMNIAWFSYTEDLFYAGQYKLPHAELAALFAKGLEHPGTGKHVTYDSITIGLAPEGLIVVWLRGAGVSLEVAHYQAEPADIPWNAILDNPDVERADYIEIALEDTIEPAGIQRLEKEGIPKGRWKKWRQRYPWTPEVTAKQPIHLWITYFNGERDFISYSKKQEELATRAAPKELVLWWSKPESGETFSTTIQLDETEIFQALDKLAAVNAKDPMQLALTIDANGRSATVAIKNSKFAILLKKCQVKTGLIPK